MKYKIEGESMPVVICELEEGESMKSESGSMSWMSENIEMTTNAGGVGKLLGRVVSGEKAFQNVFTAKKKPGMIAFSSSFPGNIVTVEITPGHSVIAQKSAFLAATSGIETSVFFRKKLLAGLFGGEGFVMQKISGKGTAFFEVDGHAVEYTLAKGESLLVDTGNVAIISDTCGFDVVTVKGVKNVVFGGEGLFLTKITGPGKVTLQTISASSLASTLIPYLPQPTSSN